MGAVLCLPVLFVLLPAARVRPVSHLLTQVTSALAPRWKAPAARPAPAQRARAATTTASAALALAPQAASHLAALPRLQAARRQAHAAARPRGPRVLSGVVLGVWALGALLALLPVAAGMICARRLARCASPGEAGEAASLEAVRAEMPVRRPVRLRVSEAEVMPMVWGWWRPVVLLPAGAAAWTPERRRLVLLHELAHVQRADCLLQHLAHLACALYWFHPLVWLAARRLWEERERACDDLVLAAGPKASVYAAHLLQLTRALRRPGLASVAAIAMAHSGRLGGRIRDVLDPRRNRAGVTRRVVAVGVLTLAVLLAPLARVRAFAAPGGGAAELVSADRGPGGEALYLWQVSQSWSGDAQSDSRLDAPVTMWQAGISLPEVFAQVEQQTRVKIGFWPADDQNRRVRVHLFLNPRQPPTLRDVMAQLEWVVDCQFSFAEGGGEKVYYLMGTTLGRGAPAAIKARQEQAAQQVVQQQQTLNRKLGELKEALSLSREDAIARYQGVDDRMLLGLLDRRRRGAALIVVNRVLPMLEQVPVGPDGGAYGGGMADFTPEERAAMRDAFGVPAEQFGDPKVVFCAQAGADGRVTLKCPITRYADGNVGPAGDYAAEEYEVLDLRPGAALEPEEEVALRRALGETITPEQEKQYLADQRAAREAAKPREATSRLSARARELLEGTRLVLRGSANWQIEEAVAEATGLNVVSDGLLYAWGRAPEKASAFEWLDSFYSQKADPELRTPEWEWGDAGSFLRFRTANRDVWRAAMLPQELVDWMDGWTRAHLPEGGKETSVSFRLEVEPEAWTRYLRGLSELQVRYGSRVMHGDPRDLLEAARRATSEQVCSFADVGLGLVQFLGSLSEDQWRLLRSGNLRAPEDITPNQRQAMEAVVLKGSMQQQLPRYDRLHISLGQAEPEKQGRLETSGIEIPDPTTGHVHGVLSSSGSVGANPGSWHQAVFTAVVADEKGVETMVFTWKAAFLPKELSVRAEVPREN